MAERINKDAFIANILECFTLLQTYEECYKEILYIIDVINGLNESDLTVENLQKLVEGSEYISLDINEAGNKLVISLDRTHVDETVKEDSTNLVTSGAVFDAVANANGNVLRLPINVPTEPLVVMIGTNNAQTNVPLGDGLAVVNNHLVATGGGGGGGISPSEANTFTAKQTFSGGIVSTKQATADDELTTLAQMKNSNLGNQEYTNTKFNTLNDQLVATNTEVAKKLDKATTTSGSYAYCRNGNKDETIPVNSLIGKDAIVRRTSTGTIKANAGVEDNDCVNKKQLDDAISGVGGGGAQLNVANTWTAIQTFNAGIDTSGAISISGQGSIDINGSITCDGGLNLAGEDISNGGTGNFSALVTSSSYLVDISATSSSAVTMEALKVKYKYVSNVYTQTYYIAKRNSNIGAMLISNKDLNSPDFEWDNSLNRLKLSMHIVSCDQSFYDSLTNKDKATLYIITE